MESERLLAAKLRPEEYELHIRTYNLDEFAGQDENPILPKEDHKLDNNEGLRREINKLKKGVKTKEELVAT